MTVVPESGGRATACPTAVRPSRVRVPDESVLPAFELSPELSRVVDPAVLWPAVLEPVDPLPLRETACPPSDDDPDETLVGVDREGPEEPPEEPPDDVACTPLDPLLLDPPPLDPLFELAQLELLA